MAQKNRWRLITSAFYTASYYESGLRFTWHRNVEKSKVKDEKFWKTEIRKLMENGHKKMRVWTWKNIRKRDSHRIFAFSYLGK